MPLTENKIVDAVAQHLAAAGWTIAQKLLTTDHGTDIIAERSDRPGRLLVEAKGGTSSKEHTRRFGKPFDGGQVKSHVSVAFYYAAALQERHRADLVAIALPGDARHRAAVEAIGGAIRTLGIGVYLVADDGSVCEWAISRRG